MEVNYNIEKNVIECLIVSSKKPLSIEEINKEYEKHCGKSIPYLQLGYSSLENYILSLSENICPRYASDGTLFLTVKTPNAAQHVKNLINHQNDKSKSKRRIRRKGFSSYSYSEYSCTDNRMCNKFQRSLHYQVQQRIKSLLNFHPGGVKAQELHYLYNEEYPYYKNDLNFRTQGFSTLEELLSFCSPDVLTWEGPMKNRIFYPKVRLDSFQLAKTIEASQIPFSESINDGTLFEEVENNRVRDEPFATFDMEFFRNVITFPIEVGEIYTPVKFYLLIKSFSSKLDELTLEMETFYQKNGNMAKWAMKTSDIVFEQPSAVYDHEEKTFYRSIITSVSGIDVVKVYLVDYGTNTQIKNSQLFYLHKTFFELPAQAIHARLYNLELRNSSSKFINKASHKFLEFISRFESLTAEIHNVDVDNYSLSIEVFGDDGISINEMLVKENYCIYSFNHKQNQEELVAKQLKQESDTNTNCNTLHDFPQESRQTEDFETFLKKNNEEELNVKQLQQESNYSTLCDDTQELARITKDLRASFAVKNDELVAEQLTQENDVNVNYDTLNPYLLDLTSSTCDIMTSFEEKLNFARDREVRFSSLTNSLKNSATSDTGFLSSSEEYDYPLAIYKSNSIHQDSLSKALISLDSARTFIEHKRRQIFSKLNKDSSLNSLYVNLSTIKANIVALETELRGIIRNN